MKHLQFSQELTEIRVRLAQMRQSAEAISENKEALKRMSDLHKREMELLRREILTNREIKQTLPQAREILMAYFGRVKTSHEFTRRGGRLTITHDELVPLYRDYAECNLIAYYVLEFLAFDTASAAYPKARVEQINFPALYAVMLKFYK